jgi:hypothetical protein
MARWVCPRVVFGCRSRRAAPRSREARSCRQQGPRERGSDLRHTERFARVKGVDGRHRGWPAARSSPAVAGRSRERRRAKASRRWKASRITIQRVNVHAFAKEVISAALPDQGRASARERGGKRQGCQRHGSRAPQREDNARRGRAPPAEANRLPWSRRSPRSRRRIARDASGTHEARVLVRRGETAEVGPTHRASRRTTSRKAESSTRRLPKTFPRNVLTNTRGNAQAKTVWRPVRSPRPSATHCPAEGGNPGRSRHDRRRPDRRPLPAPKARE